MSWRWSNIWFWLSAPLFWLVLRASEREAEERRMQELEKALKAAREAPPQVRERIGEAAIAEMLAEMESLSNGYSGASQSGNR